MRLAALALLMLASPAAAQDFTLYGGVAIERDFNQNADDSSYVYGYLEAETGALYAGIWLQLADPSVENEVDLYVGYRNAVGQLSYDAHYYRYIYPDDGGDCCGELGLTLDYAVSDVFSLGTDMNYDPENESGSAYLTFSLAAGDRVTISGSYGFANDGDGLGDYGDGDIGVAYALGEKSTAEIRYYKSEGYDAYVGVSLAWDTTILSR